ncbi:MAG: class I SAM-dependent methyltransferase [Anaerolineales bacterium]|jgi:ubiquinone/menaquinone biosynthesis C-methylase UbiE
MRNNASDNAWEFYAQTYDAVVSGWQGELDFYLHYAAKAREEGQAVLEMACGTGRIAIPLAQRDVEIVGLDISPHMLNVARGKSAGMEGLRWVEADMRSFMIDASFGLALIPGHSFQNLVTAEDQVACLETISSHLTPGGRLIVHLDHQSVDWLGDLVRQGGGKFEKAELFTHPEIGSRIQPSYAWSYEPSTQTAILQTVWEELGEEGNVINRWDSGPVRLHCVFRFEMEHLLALTGYELEALYGDFVGNALIDESESMIWVARKPV